MLDSGSTANPLKYEESVENLRDENEHMELEKMQGNV